VGLEDKPNWVAWVGEKVPIKLFGPETSFELEGALVSVEGDCTLGNPGKSFGKAVVRSIKEYTSEAKRVADCAISCDSVADSLVPPPDSRM
jgi:hypothetical protein